MIDQYELRIKELGNGVDLTLEVFARSNGFTGTVETYCTRNEFYSFAKSLVYFPASLADVAILEIGEDLVTYDYLFIKAQILDSVGHSQLNIVLSNLNVGRLEVRMNLDPAEINEIGAKLLIWIDTDREEFVWPD